MQALLHGTLKTLLSLSLFLITTMYLIGGDESLSDEYKGLLNARDHLPTLFTENTKLTTGIRSFIGIAGPYEIRDHYQHESLRCVENISAMKPAMGGIDNFHHHSPTTLLASAPFTSRRNPQEREKEAKEKEHEHKNGKSFEEHKNGKTFEEKKNGKEKDEEKEEAVLEHVSIFPPIYLMHGKKDKTVPVLSSQRFYQELRLSGQRTALKLFEDIGHADFVLGLMDASYSFHHSLFEEVLNILRANNKATPMAILSN